MVTDDAKALRETLEAATGERVSALEGIGAAAEKPLAEGKSRDRGLEGLLERAAGTEDTAPDKSREPEPEKVPEPKQKSVEMDFGLQIDRSRAPVRIQWDGPGVIRRRTLTPPETNKFNSLAC